MSMDFRSLSNRWGAADPNGSPTGPSGPGGPDEDTPLMVQERAQVRAKPKMKLSPEESVYSSMLFLPPISRLTTGAEWSRPSRLAILLCILNSLLQMGVVYVISVYNNAESMANIRLLLPQDEVIEEGDHAALHKAKDFSDSSRKSDQKTKSWFLPPNEKKELAAVQEIEPLCKRMGDGNGTFTCMPHSVKFAFEWKHLDHDKDGVWTLSEAKADKANLRAKRGVSPETIFNNIINGLRFHAQYVESSGPNRSFYLSPDVENEKAIPKAYFNFWKGDAMMCGHFDPNSCEAAAKAGIFDAALVPGRMSSASKGIRDLDTAIEYCYRMLSPGGGCEAGMPTDFKQNREQRWGRCGTRSLVEGGKFTNPYNADQSVHVLEATYSTVNRYMRATSRLYVFFQAVIIMLWLLSLIDEWRELLKFVEFLIVFPGLMGAGDKGGSSPVKEGSDDGETTTTITGISKKHRGVLVFFFLVRVNVCAVLTRFGTSFLLVEQDYLNLVLNSLALTFVLTVDSMLFDLLDKDTQNAIDNTKPVEWVTKMPTEGWLGYCLKKECWGLFLVPVVSVGLVLCYNYFEKEPILVVLRCACTQEGQKCLDSAVYQASWWEDYWGKTLPAAIHQIEAMRIAGK